MDLWAAVQGMLRDYYNEFGASGSQEGESRNLFQSIIERASRDYDFRKRLLRFPVKTLAKEGFRLPRGFSVRFVEEPPDAIFIPIPPYIGEAPGED